MADLAGAWALADALESLRPEGASHEDVATVTRVDADGSVWVRLLGTDVETPVNGAMTASAAKGQRVLVRVEDGRLSVLGNPSEPSVGASYVERAVVPVERKALAADVAASLAHDAAQRAEADAATSRQAANAALVNLSVIEDVAGTLSWISEHGSYVLTTDTTVQAGTVYFELVSGDYVPIASPDPSVNPSQQGWYVLDVTDSQSDYIMAHLAVTSAGLWVLPSGIDGADAQHSTGYKALLASSSMSIFDGSGMIVASYGSETAFYDGLGSAAANIIAKFGGQGARIGYESGTHVDVKSDGMSLTTPSTNESFSVGLGERAVSRSEWVSTAISSVPTDHTLQYTPQQGSVRVYMVTYGDSANPPQGEDSYSYTVSGKVVTITDQRLVGHEYDVIYTATDFIGLALTSGSRKNAPIGICSSAFGRAVSASGEYSFAEGNGTTASGDRSHSEGWNTEASGDSSHAEGYYAKASGYAAHAGGYVTIASGRAQTAIGKWNVEDTSDKYALIIGNGTGNGTRSNALAVDWDGGLYLAGHDGPIGEVVTNDIDTAVSVPDSTWTSIGSVTLSAGVWVLEQHGIFTSNATGRRAIASSTTADSAGNATEQRQAFTSQQATNGTGTGIDASRILNLTSSATFHLNVYQNSGSSLNVTGYIRAVRIR